MRIRFTILKQALALIAVPLVFQLVFVTLLLVQRRHSADAEAWSLHSKAVLSQISTVERGLLEGQNSIRGYVITGGSEFSETYARVKREGPLSLERLQDLVRDNPVQNERAEALRQTALELFRYMDYQESRVREGRLEAAADSVKQRLGLRQMNELRGQIGEFQREELRLDEERAQTLQTAQQRLNWLLMGGALLAVATSVVVVVAFGRGLGRRFGILTENVRRLERGQTLVSPVKGSDEIGDLDRAFHELESALRSTDNELREQSLVLRSVLDNMSDGVAVADESGRFLVFNPAAERILGRGASDVAPEKWSDAYATYMSDAVTPYPANDLPLTRALRGEAVDNQELYIARDDGEHRVWISISGRPLPATEGGRRCGVVVFRDVTERKLAADRVRQLNLELEEKVRERTLSLEEANRELAQRNQENEMFVYSVSHDLRSPLVNLQGFSKELSAAAASLRSLIVAGNLASDDKKRGLAIVDDDMADSIRFVQTAVMRLSRIIDGLLRLSRSGRVEYQRQEVNADAVATRILEAMSATIASRSAVVRLAKLPPVWADPAAVEQIFANLIGNALNYLDPTRPGVVEVGCLPATASDTTPAGASHRTFFVRDNGLGIPEICKAKIFQAFQRVHPTVAQGEGIGLAIVQRVVERLDGRIWFESSEGGGTTFFVKLPAAGKAASLEVKAAPPGEENYILPFGALAHESGTTGHPVGGR